MEFDKTNIITTHNRLVPSSSLGGATIFSSIYVYRRLFTPVKSILSKQSLSIAVHAHLVTSTF